MASSKEGKSEGKVSSMQEQPNIAVQWLTELFFV
jgi:hypothetical protein